ncbi:hypothetical protein IEN85_02250 [Pelagicoccus sp. NFK12]|uniref:Periplasmic heavy metal sensor n=1 Tax=Pelagicoccus enzymogenes TaxID=2773457 RepID=A0A927F4M4_9BACT|nr:hypothetical protein [Pelagicoccus enzymogenes]MBD5778314.1 hypothetical protein [Pelagicoccus enzymogenes]
MWKSISVIVVGLACGIVAHLSYVNAFAPVCLSVDAECEMEWLRSELDLSEEQFASITRLHVDREREIRMLSRKVRDLELLLAELEAERVTSGYVDYLEIRNYMEAKRKLDEACVKSTSDLIASVSDVMNVDQRKRYFSIVQNRIN